MTYYDTLDEDLTRAKEILEKGKPTADDFEGLDVASIIESLPGGTIFGGDVYAAYKLLESFVEQITRDRTVMQRVMQVLGPDAVCECAGCAWETTEAIRLLTEEAGITYQQRDRPTKPPHDKERERRGNAVDNDTQLATLVSDIKALAGLCKFRKVNPFDHNGECLICDEMGEHAEECAWRLVEIIRE